MRRIKYALIVRMITDRLRLAWREQVTKHQKGMFNLSQAM